MESVLGAPLEDVVGAQCPFLVLQELGLPLIERAAKMTPEVGAGTRAIEQIARARAVETRIMIHHVARQGCIIQPQPLRKGIEVRGRNIAARQRGVGGPGTGHGGEIRLQPVERMFRQLAKGCDLAAEHRQQRQRAIGVVEFENVVPRYGGRIFGVVVEQRSDPGKRMDDVGACELADAKAIDGAKQIADFVFTGRDAVGFSAVGDVRGSDQAEIALDRD